MNDAKIGSVRVGDFRVGAGPVRTHMSWELGTGDGMGEMVDEQRDWQILALTFRATEQTVENVLRPLDSSVGKVDIVERPDGSYKAISRAGGENVHTLLPPTDREDHRTTNEYAMNSYDETQQGRHGDVYEVELELVGLEPKTGGTDHGTVEAAPAEWHFALADGEIASRRVEHDIGRGGSTVEDEIELTLNLSKEEAIVFEESLNRQAATRIREVPDAPDLAEDRNDNGRNTIDITPPSEGSSNNVIPADSYVVEEWTTTLLNDIYFQATMTIHPSG